MGLVIDSEKMIKAVALLDYVVLFFQTQAVVYGKGTTYGEYSRIVRIPKECQNIEYYPPHGTAGYVFLGKNNTLCALSAQGDFFLGEADGTNQFSFAVFPTNPWLPDGRKILQISHTTNGYLILTDYGELFSFGYFFFTHGVSLAQEFPTPPFLFPFFGLQFQRPSSITLPKRSTIFPPKPLLIDVSSTGDNIALFFSDKRLIYTLDYDKKEFKFDDKNLPRQFSVGFSHFLLLQKNATTSLSINTRTFGASNPNVTIMSYGWTNEFGQLGDGTAGDQKKQTYVSTSFLDKLPAEPGEVHNLTFVIAETESSLFGVDFVLRPTCDGLSYTEISVCSSRGKCMSENKCSCFIGYYGDNCEKSYICGGKSNDDPKVCWGFGNCIKDNQCACFEGYYGSHCESYKCFGVLAGDSDKACSHHGNCTAPDTCACDPGYIGAECSRYQDTAPDVFLSGHYYQWNLGADNSIKIANLLKKGEGVKKIVTAQTSIMCLTTEGRLFTFGMDKNFETGFGMDKFGLSEARELEFFQAFRVKYGITVLDVAAGSTFVFAYLSNFKIYVWGTFSNLPNSEPMGTDNIIFTYPHPYDRYFDLSKMKFDENFKLYAFGNLAFGTIGSKLLSLTPQAGEVVGFKLHDITDVANPTSPSTAFNILHYETSIPSNIVSYHFKKLCVLKNGVIGLLKNGDVWAYGDNDKVDFPFGPESYATTLFPGHSSKNIYHLAKEFDFSASQNSMLNLFGWLQPRKYDIIDLECSQNGKAAAFKRGSTNQWYAWGRNTKNVLSMKCGFDPVECGAFEYPRKIDGEFPGLDPQEYLSKISLGETHSLFLSNKGKLFATGSNSKWSVNFDQKNPTVLEKPMEIMYSQTVRNLSITLLFATTPGSFIGTFPRETSEEVADFKCFGFPKDFTIGCNGNGACIAPNWCECRKLYWGNTCERYIIADFLVLALFVVLFMSCSCCITTLAVGLIGAVVAFTTLCSCFFCVSNYRVNSYKKHQKKQLLRSLINPNNLLNPEDYDEYGNFTGDNNYFIDPTIVGSDSYVDYPGEGINISSPHPKKDTNSHHSSSSSSRNAGKSPASFKRNKANPLLKFDSDLFNIDFNEIKDLEELEAGGSGALAFKGRWKQEVVFCKLFVAICDSVAGPDLASFRMEVSLLSSLKHSNIVSFFGLFYAPPTRVGYVTEYCPGGNLYQVFKRKKLPLKKKLLYLIQVCKGMRFLHQKGIIFRDLKCQNILLDENDVIKLTDFGISRRVDSEEKKRLTQRIGTNQYMAPEMVKGEEYDSKVDVFSYAIVMYELLFETTNPYGKDYSKISIEYRVAQDPTFRPKKPEADIWTKPEETAIFEPLFSIMEKAWSEKPNERPDFGGLVSELSALYFELP